jgi:flagellar secretion chaperone FliS
LAIDARLAYVESEILQADPVRLVRMLYGGALDATAQARGHIRLGDIGGRSRQITKAVAIINELMLSLDRERGGEIAANLAELYDYINRRLQDANFRQIEEPLIETERLLTTLLDAWDQCHPAPSLERPPAYASQQQPPHIADDFPTYAPPSRLVVHG